jgi:hypothetical protein
MVAQGLPEALLAEFVLGLARRHVEDALGGAVEVGEDAIAVKKELWPGGGVIWSGQRVFLLKKSLENSGRP